jgi:pyruvate formate lyase activating enzyme
MRSSPESRTSSNVSDSAGADNGGRTGRIFNIQRFSIEDGPGIRTTVFMKGCPLSCVWCHNPEGIAGRKQLMWFDVRCIGARDCLKACPVGALELSSDGMKIDREACDGCGLCQAACPAGAIEVVGRDITAQAAFEEVARDEAFYRNSGGGLTVSGGEPTMQPAFVAELMRLCRDAGIPTALDTCGYCAGDALERLLPLSDMVLVDLKVMDEARHLELTGVDLATVLASARTIAAAGKPVWVRTPVIGGRTDSEENIAAIAEFIRSEMQPVVRWDLLAFNNTCGSKYARLDMPWELEGTGLIEKQHMEALAAVAGSAGCEVHWAGVTARESDGD